MIFPEDKPPNCIRILAIDPGTDTMGIVVVDVDIETFHPTLVDECTINAKKSHQVKDKLSEHNTLLNRDIQLAYIEEKLRDILRQVEPDTIASESPFLNPSNVTSFEALTECFKMIRTTVYAYRPSMMVYRIAPAVAKSAVGVSHMGTDKHDIYKGVERCIATGYLTSNVDIEAMSEHAVDAVTVSIAHIKLEMSGEMTRKEKKPKKRKKRKKP